LNLFANLLGKSGSCPDPGYTPLAMNSDGSINSCTNPALSGSTISFYVHGAGGFGPPSPQALGLQVSFGACSAAVTNSSLIDGYVYKVDVSLPASPAFCLGLPTSVPGVPNYLSVTFSYDNMPVGPLSVPVNLDGTLPNVPPPGYPLPMYVWVNGNSMP
jgi:hypothetical protein